MIALKLVFQSLVSAAAVGGLAFGGYKFMNANFDDFFLLVSVKDTSFSNQPSSDLISETTATKVPGTQTAAQTSIFLNTDSSSSPEETPASSNAINTQTESPTSTTTKNYKCTGSTINAKVQEDEACDLYSIPFDETKKTITLAKLKAFSESPTDANTAFTKTIEKSKLTKNKLFLLKTIKSLRSSWNYSGAETIKLMSKSDTETEKVKSYAELIVHSQISSNDFSPKINFIIAEYKKEEPVSVAVDATNKTFECYIGEKSTKKACVIKAFTTTPTPKTVDSLTFSDITPSSAQASETITKDKLFFIKLSNEMKFSISELADKNVVFVSTKNTTDTSPSTTITETELEIKASIFALPTYTTAFDEVIILK